MRRRVRWLNGPGPRRPLSRSRNHDSPVKLVDEYSHRLGAESIDEAGQLEPIRRLCAGPILLEKGAGPAVNEYFRMELASNGWALDARVDPRFNLDVNALRDGIALTVQTGNITRAFYDLLKFQTMHLNDRASAGILILPSALAAARIGSNIANFERVASELKLFKHIIVLPCLLLSIE
jgi:hypothetical protein